MSEPFDYDPQTWANGVEGGTKLNDVRLNHIEAGIDAAAATAAEALALEPRLAAVEADLAAATPTNTVSTIVERDATGAIAVSAVTGLSTATSSSQAVPKLQLDSAINTEASTRASADTTLQTNIDGKAAAVHTHATTGLAKRTVIGDYTLVAGDIDVVLHITAAAVITLPADTVSIAQEIAIPWRAYTSGAVSFAAGAGATVHAVDGVLTVAGQYAEGLVTKVAANTWIVSGVLG